MEIKVIPASEWQMLPPPKDCCQVCGAKHDAAEPHDPQQWYYRIWFKKTYGREVTWADAMAHCEEKVVVEWTELLQLAGVNIHSSDTSGGIKTPEDRDRIVKEYQEFELQNAKNPPSE